MLFLLFLVPVVSGLYNANPQTSACLLFPTNDGFGCNASWTPYTITNSGWQVKAESTARPGGTGWIYLQYESVNGDNYTVCSTFCEQYVDDYRLHTHNVSDEYPTSTIWIGCNNKVKDCKLKFNVTMWFPGSTSPSVLPLWSVHL